jgi:hypothetical protein
MIDVDKIAKKVANEPIENMKEKTVPQHIKDENRADIIKARRKELAQMEMYNDPYMNWSGNR